MRLRQLDSIRGLAAVAVMLHHYAWMRLDTQRHVPIASHGFWLAFQLLHPLVLGHEAVMVFFVLSGLVLTGAIMRRVPLAYAGYLVHRVCRIYLPYLGALAISVGGCALLHGRSPHWSPWGAQIWSTPPDHKSIVQHLLFIGYYPPRFNSVFWSLIVEMRVSIVLPFVVLLFRRLSLGAGGTVTCIVTIVDSLTMPWAERHCAPRALDLLSTAHYSIFFMYGVLLSLHAASIHNVFTKLTALVRTGLLLISFMAICYLWAVWNTHIKAVQPDFLAALGAVGVLCCAMYDNKLSQLLIHPVLSWLGDISFSLYLLHIPVIVLLGVVLGQTVPYVIIAIVGIVATLGSAQLFLMAIEGPARRLGRVLDNMASG